MTRTPRATPTAPAAHPRPPRLLRGALLYAGALALFACLDATVKHLTQNYPVPAVAAARYASQFLLMSALLLPQHGAGLLRTRQPALVTLRSAALVVLTLMMNSALQRLPLAEATAISFAAPLLIVLLAGPLLGERLTAARSAGVAAGFVGVLLIAQPGGQLDPLGVTFALLAAAANAGYGLLSRALGSTERPLNMLYSSALVGTVAFSALLPWFWHGPPVTAGQGALLFSLGMTGGAGHLLFTLAYREAPASFLAPLTYLQLVWAALLGAGLFGHVPSPTALGGMLLVSVAGVSVALHDAARARR